MTPAGKTLKEDCQWQAKTQWKQPILTGPVAIEITLFYGDKRARDIDNCGKLLLDALTGIVWEDDRQIVEMAVAKAFDKARPRVEIEIEPTSA